MFLGGTRWISCAKLSADREIHYPSGGESSTWPVAHRKQSHPNGPSPEKPRRLDSVLCIDDEEDFQSIIRISLERLGGIKAHFCTDPRLGMAKAREVGPDLILLDLMPGLDGATLSRQLQADPELASIPVVFLTAVMTGPAARNLQTLGAAGILVKPFDVLELPRRLATIWGALQSVSRVVHDAASRRRPARRRRDARSSCLILSTLNFAARSRIVFSTSSSGGGSPWIQRSGLMRATTKAFR